MIDLNLPPSPAWMADALCAQTDPEEHFPENGRNAFPAKATCAACPVREQCLQYALANDERWGIWGGLTEGERHRLKGGKRPRGKVRCNHGHEFTAANTRINSRGHRACRQCDRDRAQAQRDKKAAAKAAAA